MDRNEAKAIIENILFIADAPLSVESLAKLFEGEFEQQEMAEIMGQLRDDYEAGPLQLTEVAEGWRIQTRPEYAKWITSYYKMDKGQKLSRASLEALAIIAYRQPVTRAEVDEIRGVDSGGVMRGLIDKGMVKGMGRRKAPGRPMMYGTTKRFLEYFGLARLSDMPTLEEFGAEMGDAFAEQRQGALEFETELADDGVADDDRDGDEFDESETFLDNDDETTTAFYHPEEENNDPDEEPFDEEKEGA